MPAQTTPSTPWQQHLHRLRNPPTAAEWFGPDLEAPIEITDHPDNDRVSLDDLLRNAAIRDLTTRRRKPGWVARKPRKPYAKPQYPDDRRCRAIVPTRGENTVVIAGSVHRCTRQGTYGGYCKKHINLAAPACRETAEVV